MAQEPVARNPDPHSPIKYPSVYEGLRRHGFTKEAAARISNAGPAAWRRGGERSHSGSRHPFNNLVSRGRANQSARQSELRSKTIPKGK